MAQKRRRTRRKFNLRPVRFGPNLALGTLATKAVLVNGLTGVATASYRCISVRGAWDLTDLTANDGPIIVGYAHSDYTTTEIKEALESSASINQGKKVEQERGNRLVRIVGTMNEVRQTLNDGEPITTKLNWLIVPGQEVKIFAYNDGAALLTTGAFVGCQGTMFVKDSA